MVVIRLCGAVAEMEFNTDLPPGKMGLFDASDPVQGWMCRLARKG